MGKVSEGNKGSAVIEQTDDSRRLMPGVQADLMSRRRQIVRYAYGRGHSCGVQSISQVNYAPTSSIRILS